MHPLLVHELCPQAAIAHEINDGEELIGLTILQGIRDIKNYGLSDNAIRRFVD